MTHIKKTEKRVCELIYILEDDPQVVDLLRILRDTGQSETTLFEASNLQLCACLAYIGELHRQIDDLKGELTNG
jgi:hypothetical protein